MGEDHQVRIYYQNRWNEWSVQVVNPEGGGRGVAVADIIPGGPDEFVVSYHVGDSVTLWAMPAPLAP